ncbi:MAG TPA: endonuclease III [Acidobacteriaceae bacterium]|nr:endonuclease III [Acidobacteriaceae bacterium]
MASSAKKKSIVRGRLTRKQALAPERIAEILKRLQAAYPDAVCALHHKNAWELMVATILSAQCTDTRVNLVTPTLFKLYPTPKAMSTATPAAIEEIIRSTGFFRNKTKSLLGAAKLITQEYGGEVPQTMEALLKVPGVARKTANVVLGSWYEIADGIVVDTHVYRISRRLDLTTSETAEKVEADLMRVIPRDRWIDFSHEVILHGRAICLARKPKCMECPLENLCYSPDKTWSSV